MSAEQSTCAVCGQPGHRYGTTDKQHKFDAVACVNGLLPKIAELEAENAGLSKECFELCEERDRLREALQIARNDLEEYGTHSPECAVRGPCDCGLREALNKVNTK